MLKTIGYLISTLSVLILGAVSWRASARDPDLRAWLIAGVAASILGMFCRWLSYRLQERPGHGSLQAAPARSSQRTS